MRKIEYANIHEAANKIATILAESEATIADINSICREVKQRLRVVAVDKVDMRDFSHVIRIPEDPDDFDRIGNE